MTDAIIGEWQARIRAAAASKSPLRIRGGGSKDFYGQESVGEVLDATPYAGIVDYDPTELVVTARSGTPLADVERALADAGQMLAFEPPHFGARATLGGAIAAGLSGPRRPYAGAVRDLVLGVRILDGQGADLAFGGRVMKNVAGFDVARLMAGALGTLGLLLEISVKCQPRPKAVATRVLECPPAEGVRRACAWAGQPLSLSATCQLGERLHVRVAGAAPAVEAAVARIGGDAVPSGDDFFGHVREHAHPFFEAARAPGRALWRLSVKATTPHAELGGPQLVEWGGALRWLDLDARADAKALRAWAAAHGGHATLFRGGDKAVGVFQPLPEPLLALHRRLKANFDPQGILNRGRMYPDF
jgi:glycolate oxidase FAD binding subunit